MKLWFCEEIQLLFGLIQETRSLTVKSQTQSPSSAGMPGTSALFPVSPSMQLSQPTIKDTSRAFVLFPRGLHKLHRSNGHIYDTMGNHQAVSIKVMHGNSSLRFRNQPPSNSASCNTTTALANSTWPTPHHTSYKH